MRHRSVGILGALLIAVLGMVVTMSFQLGRIDDALGVLLGHIVLKSRRTRT
jgi:hypothetical protein